MGPVELFPVAASMLVLGIALLWTLRITYGLRRPGSDDVMRLALSIGGSTMALAGLLTMLVVMYHVFALIGWGFVGATLVYTIIQLRHHERRTLLWALSAATERSIPLPAVARAISAEQGMETGNRTIRLAALLEQGVPLAKAFERARIALDIDSELSLRIASESGNQAIWLSPRLAGTNPCDSQFDFEEELRDLANKSFYLATIIAAALAVVAFFLIKLMPVIVKMFAEFDLKLPAVTELLIACVDQLYFPLMVFGVVVLVGYLMLFIWNAANSLRRLAVFSHDFPLLSRLGRDADRSRVLRAISSLLSQAVDIEKAADLLSRTYPKTWVRTAMWRVTQRIQAGTDWIEVIGGEGFVSPTESAVLRSAVQVGNLTWALREVGDQKLRRLLLRMKLFSETAFPLAFLMLGACVFWIALAFFMPLVSLITGLSHP